MNLPRPTIRLRLTALYAALAAGSTGLLLALSWWLLHEHFERTLPPLYARTVLDDLASQYLLALVGVTLLAIGGGWAAAGRALSPVRRIAATARRVSKESLDERIALDGPDDELRELAETLDEMLDRLQDALEAQQRFVVNASHELRSPLTVIRTEAEVTLADPDAGEADLRRMGRIVLEATDRSEALLDGLLTLAVGRRGPRTHDAVDLARLARRVATAVGPEAEEHGVQLTVRAGPAVVRGDIPLLERLVANLAENAVRHNEPGGFADLEVRADNGHALVRVVNGGRQIEGDVLERLTEPFQRLDRTSTRRGHGLGLSIVRTVAEAHGGELRLHARPDGGLEAEVQLPAEKVPGAAPYP